MTTKNEVTTVANVTKNVPAEPFNPAAFIEELQSVISLSPLAHGTKFESEDIVNAEDVVLNDLDIVEYKKSDGEEVRFAVWRCETTIKGEKYDGYYQSGAVLTKLADHILENNQIENVRAHGIRINATWGKTSTKNNIVLVDIVGVAR